LFTATVRERDGRFVVELPEREIDHGVVQPGGTYRVAVLPSGQETEAETETTAMTQTGTDHRVTERRRSTRGRSERSPSSHSAIRETASRRSSGATW
jgi:hypothetical protein